MRGRPVQDFSWSLVELQRDGSELLWCVDAEVGAFGEVVAEEWEGARADRVAATSVTGNGIVSVASDRFVSVILPTDAGSYRFDMVKRVDEDTSGGVWVVFEMAAPVSE